MPSIRPVRPLAARVMQALYVLMLTACVRVPANVSAPATIGPTSTWNGFKAIEPGQLIDCVLGSSLVTVLSHGILPDSWDGRFPSDHLPVLSTLTPCQ